MILKYFLWAPVDLVEIGAFVDDPILIVADELFVENMTFFVVRSSSSMSS